MAERIIKPDAGTGNKLTLQDEGGTRALTVDDGANVGIGTDSPKSGSSLHIKGALNTFQLVVADSTDETKTYIGQYYNVTYITNNQFYDGSWNIDDATVGASKIQLDSGGSILLANQAAGAGSATTKLSIDSAGDVYSTAWTTFTPTCTGITSLSSERGWYKRIGYWVDVFVDLYGSGTEVYRTVTNLPYTVSSDTGYYAIPNIMYVVNNGSVLSYGGGSGDVRGYAANGGTVATFALGNNPNGWGDGGLGSGITASFSYQVESI